MFEKHNKRKGRTVCSLLVSSRFTSKSISVPIYISMSRSRFSEWVVVWMMLSCGAVRCLRLATSLAHFQLPHTCSLARLRRGWANEQATQLYPFFFRLDQIWSNHRLMIWLNTDIQRHTRGGAGAIFIVIKKTIVESTKRTFQKPWDITPHPPNTYNFRTIS